MVDFNIRLGFIFSLVIYMGCGTSTQVESDETVAVVDEEKQEQIVKKYLEEDAWNYHYYSKEWHEAIDRGLAEDSTIAYLWQQKAMPLFKQGKYQYAMPFLDKAVKYNPREWLEYRAFMKCIFSKDYKGAIEDFEASKKLMGDSFVMDHSYEFYIALSLLQLNEFEEAERILTVDIEKLDKAGKSDLVHHVDLFYLGISQYEQQKFETAIETFDRALAIYNEFSDVQHYKALCLNKIGNKVEAELLMEVARKNSEAGYTITDDNVVYERYPYQVRW